MKKISFLIVLIMFGLACHKQLARSVNQENEPRITVATDTADLNDDSALISGKEENEHAVYSFMGVSGLYFGCSSTFKTDKESLEFIFGTSKTTNLNFTQEEFEQLIHTGERQFGSLGAFDSYPQRMPDKVEIAYTDKHGRKWCSTRIKEQQTPQGVETTVEIERGGEFYLEEAHKIEIAAETEGYRLKGRFKCTLFEVNGNARRKIKGEFTGIVAPQ